MTGKDLSILEIQNDDTLAEWWCVLNHWEWPEGLPDPMTEKERTDYDLKTISITELRAKRDSQVMSWIEERIGHKKISRFSNKDSMDNEQFELFWKGYHEGDKEAMRKYDEFRWTSLGGEGPPPGYK